MKIINIHTDDYSNYKCEDGRPSLFVGIGTCDWKCCRESGLNPSICQNSSLAESDRIDISAKSLYDKYLTSWIGAVVVGGLEPFTDTAGLYELAGEFSLRRSGADFVIYTGYYEYEISGSVMDELIYHLGDNRLIIKFGRFVPNREAKYDSVLGVELASPNQYGKIICDKRPMVIL